MPTLNQIARGPLTRSEALTYRLPLVTLLALGAVAGVGAAGKAGIDRLTTEYGCATSTVKQGGTTIAAAIDAAGTVAPSDTNLEAVVTYAAQSAEGAGDVQPGQPVEVCVERNPIYGFGESGWMADVNVLAVPGN